MEPAGLDVLIRLYDPSELSRLNHCLFSLLGQSLPTSAGCCGPLRLHLMLRRFSFSELQEVRTATQALRSLDETARLTVHNWELSEPFDLRVPLLNWGLEVTRCRYFACIDVGDLLFPGAYAKLLRRLRATGAALALGGVITQPVRWWGDVVLPRGSILPWPASLPSDLEDVDAPPVFLLDRVRLKSEDSMFRAGAAGMEVIDFVKRLKASYSIDMEYSTELLAVRQIPG